VFLGKYQGCPTFVRCRILGRPDSDHSASVWVVMASNPDKDMVVRRSQIFVD
jgi:hypothetical protein